LGAASSTLDWASSPSIAPPPMNAQSHKTLSSDMI
jgi:hypothetical protein